MEAAKICGVVNQTAINWIRKGSLKASTTPGGQYRVYPEDLIDFMKRNNMNVPQKLLESVQRSVPQQEKKKIKLVPRIVAAAAAAAIAITAVQMIPWQKKRLSLCSI